MTKINNILLDVFLFFTGAMAASFGLKGFLLPNQFIDGGVTGISLIINHITNIPLSMLIVAVNLPFICLAYIQMGKRFALKSILAIIALAAAVQFVPYPAITSDKLLISVFGGFFLGLGIGMAVRGGAVLDGTEVLAIFIGKRSKLSIGDVILIFNIVIFSVGAYVLSIEIALYAILTYIVASRTVDFIITGIEEYRSVTIISSYSEKIRTMMIKKLGLGVTIYQGKGGFSEENQKLNSYDILYTITTRLEIANLEREIENIDPHAFIVMSSIKDTRGGLVRKRSPSL